MPPSVPSPATESEEDEAVGKRIDYASTMEKAYDNLSKMLGPNGLNGLSAETKKLAAQQKGLLENLNNMAPVIQTARKTLDSLGGNMPNLENLQGIMEKFGKYWDMLIIIEKVFHFARFDVAALKSNLNIEVNSISKSAD